MRRFWGGVRGGKGGRGERSERVKGKMGGGIGWERQDEGLHIDAAPLRDT